MLRGKSSTFSSTATTSLGCSITTSLTPGELVVDGVSVGLVVQGKEQGIDGVSKQEPLVFLGEPRIRTT